MTQQTVPMHVLQMERNKNKTFEQAIRGCETECRELRDLLAKIADVARDSHRSPTKIETIKELTREFDNP